MEEQIAELMEQVRSLSERVSELQGEMDSLKNVTTIPYEVDQAFKERIGSLADVADKTAASETQSVNEGGVSTYSVAKPMDGFFRTASGKFVPYYD